MIAFKKEGLNFQKLSALTTDGAPSMVSENVGVVGQFRKLGLDFHHFHCAIHQFNLAVKVIGMAQIMAVVTKCADKPSIQAIFR